MSDTSKRPYLLQVMLLLFLVVATASTAGATFTTILYPYNGEPWLDLNRAAHTSVLDHLYGLSNLQRVHDSPLWGDQVWWEFDGTATAMAKYAGDNHEFGYTLGQSGGNPINWVATTGSGYNVSFDENSQHVSGGVYTISGDPFLRFNLKDRPGTVNEAIWSSLESDNTTGSDHMVTHLITGGAENNIGNYVIAWADREPGDWDFNDLVIEVGKLEPIPEPGSMLLLGLGLLGTGLAAFRRRRRG